MEKEEVKEAVKKVKTFMTSKQAKALFLLILILIPISLNIYLRTQTVLLPITDEWAQTSIVNDIRAQVASQVGQSYPNLPAAQKEELINQQVNEFIAANQEQFDQQKALLSTQIKSSLQDDSGHTYLLALDPYFWVRHAQNVVDHGHPGDEIRNGIWYDTYMLAPHGRNMPGDQLHAYFEAYLYKLIRFFNPEIPLTTVAFYTPIILVSLAIIPAFFIGRKIAGNLGGFFSAVIIAVHPAILVRTMGGFADTDAYNVFFPLLIYWIFFEMFDADKLSYKYLFAVLCGFFVGLYSFAWGGWFYIFLFLLATIGLYLTYVLFINRKKIKEKIFIKGFLHRFLFPSIALFGSLTLFVTLFRGVDQILLIPRYAFNFINIHTIKTVPLWPNVFLTVAEQKEGTIPMIISQLGGTLLFYIAIIGILLTIFYVRDKGGRRDVKYGIFLLIWFLVTMWATTLGTRFALLIAVSFALAYGAFFGIIPSLLSKLFNYVDIKGKLPIVFSVILSAMVGLLVINLIPFASTGLWPSTLAGAKHDVPSMNDDWYGVLNKINQEAAPDAIISSWWDFGHWFKEIGNRSVTFDGTSQNTPQAHWIGKVLLTNNEDQAIAILRMLDCGANSAWYKLTVFVEDKTAVDMLYVMFEMDREEANQYLVSYGIPEENRVDILSRTHCDPPENYFITSEDMVHKGGVWGHFGGWDFNKSLIYHQLSEEEYRGNKQKSVNFLINRFDLSEKEAEETYYMVIGFDSDEANNWISGWPGFNSWNSGCSQSGDIIFCDHNLRINITTWEAWIESQGGIKRPQVFVYNHNGSFYKKEYDSDVYLGFALIEKEGTYYSVYMAPIIADSMFTRLFFFRGMGLNRFELFDYKDSPFSGEIYVWNVDWDEKIIEEEVCLNES